MNAPRATLWQRLRHQVVATKVDAVLAIVLVGLAVYFIPKVARWVFVDSIVVAEEPTACAAATGACWAVVYAHARTILFGLYPYAEQWRAGIALSMVALALIATFVIGAAHLRRVVALWVLTALVFVTLMGGGLFGLKPVPTDAWGGLPLSIFVFMASVIIGFPLAVALALGRGSSLPAIRVVCTLAIE